MKKLLFGLIATVTLCVSGNANEISNLGNRSAETLVSEQPNLPISIVIEIGRLSRACRGFGICGIEITHDFQSPFKASADTKGNLVVEANNAGFDILKNHFGSSTTIVIEEDYKVSDEVCKALNLNLGYTIKTGTYSIKNTGDGVFTIAL